MATTHEVREEYRGSVKRLLDVHRQRLHPGKPLGLFGSFLRGREWALQELMATTCDSLWLKIRGRTENQWEHSDNCTSLLRA